MGYFLIFFLILVGVIKVISFFNPGGSTNHPAVHPKQKTRESDTDNYYHNYQVARSQHDDTAEQFFFMGMIDSVSRPDNEYDDFEQDEDENILNYDEPDLDDEFDDN